MADKPVYYVTPVVQKAALPATANTASDGTGTLTEVARGDAAAIIKIDSILCKMLVTNTISQVRFFFSDDGGTTKQLMPFETQAPATTVAAGTGPWEALVNFQGFPLLNANCRIYAAPYTAHAVNTLAIMYKP